MSKTTALLHTTQLLSITASLFLSGINFGAFHITFPALRRLDAQAVSLGAFVSVYHRGARLVVPFAVLSALTSTLVAFQSSGVERTKWIIAATATFASLPFNKMVIMESKKALLRFSEEEETAAGGESESLKGLLSQDNDKEELVRSLRRWKRLTIVRSAFAFIGGMVATAAVVYGR